MTLEKFLFMMCYRGSKFVKQGNREIEIITDDDLTEDMKNAEVKRYREVGNDDYNIGFGSYDLNNVLKWKEEEFEVVSEKEEQRNKGSNKQNVVRTYERNRDCTGLSCKWNQHTV